MSGGRAESAGMNGSQSYMLCLLYTSKKKLQQQIDEANALSREYENTEAGHQALLDEAEADEARMQELIRKQQQQNNNSGSSGGNNSGSTGGYIWPTNNTRVITSPYGNPQSFQPGHRE